VLIERLAPRWSIGAASGCGQIALERLANTIDDHWSGQSNDWWKP
jgi:hypothetical protein